METDAETEPSSSVLRYGDAAPRHTCPVFARISCQTTKSCKNKDLLADDAVWIGPVSDPDSLLAGNLQGILPHSALWEPARV